MATVLGVIALLVALAALVVALLPMVGKHRQPEPDPKAAIDDVPADTHALRQEVAALQRELAQSLRHLAVVRYDAFDDMGGEMSWSMVLVDDHGSGVLVTSINGRQHSRTYAKALENWSSSAQLSDEENVAIATVRP